ncbi:MAG: accessory factor UbiK family protein [Pseudomonadaceae bacterium]|nr:accessory factor UbiK family protein [Pseudomonadaceae bacterium]
MLNGIENLLPTGAGAQAKSIINRLIDEANLVPKSELDAHLALVSQLNERVGELEKRLENLEAPAPGD